MAKFQNKSVKEFEYSLKDMECKTLKTISKNKYKVIHKNAVEASKNLLKTCKK